MAFCRDEFISTPPIKNVIWWQSPNLLEMLIVSWASSSFAHEKVHRTGTSLGTVDGLAMAILCCAVKWFLFYPVPFPLHHCLSLLFFYCGTFVAVSCC